MFLLWRDFYFLCPSLHFLKILFRLFESVSILWVDCDHQSANVEATLFRFGENMHSWWVRSLYVTTKYTVRYHMEKTKQNNVTKYYK